MDSSFDWIPISISVAAIIIALVSLWESSLLPFKLEIAVGPPRFKIYEMADWIPSFDIGLSFHNTGQRTGKVIDVRLRCKDKSKGVPKDFSFYAKWIVNYSSFEANRSDRLKWIDTSVTREWYPVILSGRETRQIHLVLEAEVPEMGWNSKEVRWLNLALEVLSSDNSEWKEIDNYSIAIDKGMYTEKGSFTLTGIKEAAHRRV